MVKPEKPETPVRQMRPITGAFAKFENAGDTAEGAYDGYAFIEQSKGPVPKYRLQGEDGAVSFLGTVQIIEALSQVPLGAWVAVTFTGKTEKSGSGFRVKLFDISVEKGTKLVSPAPPTPPLPAPPAPPLEADIIHNIGLAPAHAGVNTETGELPL